MLNKVKRHRVLNEITQSELAEKIGVSRQTVHAIEAGKYIPSTLIALKLSVLFKVEVSALFELEQGD
jgi:putative transcriptional regulator